MDERGQILNTVFTIAVAGIAVIITLYVFGNVSALIENIAGENSTVITEIVQGVYQAFQMFPIVFIVMIAGLIISVLLNWTGIGLGGGARE